MAERVRAVIRGRVQGVGFRDFVQRRALALGLSGTVRNRPDGAVEVVAEGPEPALERLLEALRDGPGLAHVDGIEEQRGPAGGEFSGFRIAF